MAIFHHAFPASDQIYIVQETPPVSGSHQRVDTTVYMLILMLPHSKMPDLITNDSLKYLYGKAQEPGSRNNSRTTVAEIRWWEVNGNASISMA